MQNWSTALRQYANKLIKVGKIRVEMETIVSKMGLPELANEGQLRELGRLSDPEERGHAYIEAVGMSSDWDRMVTARDIQTVAEKRRRCPSSASTSSTYHHERIHQGLGNQLLSGDAPPPSLSELEARDRWRKRIGGLLNYYHRETA